MNAIAFTVNGAAREVEAEAHETLLEVLRERLHLIGPKEACGVGECGSCLVLVDGAAVNACLMLAEDAAGRVVETAEGLGGEGLSTVQ